MTRDRPSRDATVGIAQWLAVPGAADDNLATASRLIEEMAIAGADLIVLPEFWLCGLRPESFAADVRVCAQPLDGSVIEHLRGLAHDRRIHLVAGTIPEIDGDHCFNTAVLIGPDGEIMARHRKAHLYGALEQAAFVPGDCVTVVSETPFGTIGLSICFDGDFPEVARAMRAHGARLIVQPAAYDDTAEDWWDRLYPAHALTNGQWWVLANQAGSHGSFSLFGRSRVISPQGDVIAEAVRSAPGTTPPATTLIAPLPLRTQDPGDGAGSDVLFTQRRPDLPVATFRGPAPAG